MQKANLILHCGAANTTLERVQATRTPTATETFTPVPHFDFIERVRTALGASNMRVVEEAHSLTKDGNRYFGLLQIANCQKTSEDYSYVMGLRNSHDHSFSAGLVVGASVFVCDNLSFSGEIRIARKHTSRILEDLPILTNRAVGMLAQKWTSMNERIAAYKQAQLSDSVVHDFVIRALDAGACTVTQIPTILTEWRTPRHPEFAQDGKTAWRLFNSFTEAAKGSLMQLPKRTISLHGLLDAQVGLLTPEQKISEGVTDAEVVVEQR
jgi:hypothetical protein